MKKDMDLTGQRFGKLTVLRCVDNDEGKAPNYYSKFVCRCDCGNEIIIPRYGLFRGRTSCGCDKIKDNLTGKRIGTLTVLGLVRKDNDFSFATTWKCRCDCENEVTYPTILLKNELVSSCGCCDEEAKRIDEATLASANRGEIEGTNTNLIQGALDGVLYENNSTGVRGVYYAATNQCYRAVLVFQGKRIYLGQYKELDKAAEARHRGEQLIYRRFMEHYEDDLKEAIEAENKQVKADMVMEFTAAPPPPSPPPPSVSSVSSLNSLNSLNSESVASTAGDGIKDTARTVATPININTQESVSERLEPTNERNESLTASDRPTTNECCAEKDGSVGTFPPGTCQICGKPIVRGFRRSKYCSPECGRIALIKLNKIRRSRKETRYCDVCGKPVPSNRRRYCSEACQAIGIALERENSHIRNVAPKKYEITCADCGKKVMVASFRAYRCPECQKKARKRQNDASKLRAKEGTIRKIGGTAICENCGKEYIISGAIQKYCPICSAMKNRESQRKKPRKPKESKIICQICGKEFISYANHPPKCCSPECNKEYRHRYGVRYWAEHK